MNSLSWFIYLADVIGGLNAFFGIATGLAVVVTIMSGFFGLIVFSEDYDKDERATCLKILRLAIPAAATCGLLASLVPSQRTIMFIAASEFGEELSQTETASKAQKALDKFLSDYLEDDG